MPRRNSPSHRRHGSDDRKTLQLCAQIRRALEMSLMGDFEDEVFGDLMVESVAPNPDDSRVLVMISAHRTAASLGKAELAARLEAARGHLIEELLRAVHRRKLPELTFELVRAPETAGEEDPPDAPPPDSAAP